MKNTLRFFKKITPMLALAAMMMAPMWGWGQGTAIYEVTSTSAVSTTGTTPSGSSATYSQTYNTAKQLTNGNSATLTLSGYQGFKITSIVLEMHSNKSAGAGTLSVIAGTTTISSVSPTANFNAAGWYGAWSTTYVDVTKTPSDYSILTGEDVKIVIAATVNSLYIQKYTITYEAAVSGPAITLAPTTLFDFAYVEGSGPSAEQTFTVSGSNLTEDISIAATANYEISKASGSGYTTPLIFTQTDGNVAEQTVFVRLKAELGVGDYNDEQIIATSTGATNKTVTVSGEVTSPPPPDAPVATAATDIT
ncbi:MAG: hypothetical protein LHW64_11760, partial [Candidatus Cloacimonetes bacterium]|nr:hypothetical protein [Candidatus Cloacimonadota bacterium]MDY0230759.1 hypothetical protein [Candidatus Cloacimonadaceae bacterium]